MRRVEGERPLQGLEGLRAGGSRCGKWPRGPSLIATAAGAAAEEAAAAEEGASTNQAPAQRSLSAAATDLKCSPSTSLAAASRPGSPSLLALDDRNAAAEASASASPAAAASRACSLTWEATLRAWPRQVSPSPAPRMPAWPLGRPGAVEGVCRRGESWGRGEGEGRGGAIFASVARASPLPLLPRSFCRRSLRRRRRPRRRRRRRPPPL